jgi:hypothetical protein
LAEGIYMRIRRFRDSIHPFPAGRGMGWN